MKTIYVEAKAATKESGASVAYFKTPEDQLLEKITVLETQVAESIESSAKS